MEARSLASLNTLAANPPQYPEKPSEEKQEALVLYISRVPGTRDIILSPFKPQIKNVTAQDVASSLYYVHLGTPSSDAPAPLPISTNEAWSSSEDDSPPQAVIPRKPLPDSARPLTPESLPSGARLQPPSESLENRSQDGSRRRRDSVNSHHETVPSPRTVQASSGSGLGILNEPAESPHNRPLPGPPAGMPARKPVGSKVATELPASGSEKTVSSLSQDASVAEEGSQHGMYQTARQNIVHSSPPKNGSRRSSLAGDPFTLTLIRRDPSSGNQWNVGRVSSRQLDAAWTGIDPPESAFFAPPTYATGSTNPPIDIEIETSGYAKFRRMPVKRSADGALEAALAVASQDATPRSDSGIFSRRVVMRYSKSWTANLKSSHGASRASKNQPRSERRHCVNELGHVGTFDRRTPGNKSTRVHVYEPVGRQILYDGATTAYNPLVADQGSNTSKPGVTMASELRFDLPSLGEHARSTRDQWRGNWSKLLRPVDEGDSCDDVASPFEVNVGSERAGGGNHGKRAKLGKLIIYHDGLKMLDLVVAANIGVWWGAWEKMF